MRENVLICHVVEGAFQAMETVPGDKTVCHDGKHVADVESLLLIAHWSSLLGMHSGIVGPHRKAA